MQAITSTVRESGSQISRVETAQHSMRAARATSSAKYWFIKNRALFEASHESATPKIVPTRLPCDSGVPDRTPCAEIAAATPFVRPRFFVPPSRVFEMKAASFSRAPDAFPTADPACKHTKMVTKLKLGTRMCSHSAHRGGDLRATLQWRCSGKILRSYPRRRTGC